MHQEDICNMSMLDLFKMETVAHCQTIKNEFKLLQSKDGSFKNNNEILRAVHSIKGAAAITDLKEVVTLTGAAEKPSQP